MEHKRRRREETDSEISSEDVIIEIISRLPVKDLMRFKCVSKSWCSLITSDSHFSTLQLQRATSSDRPFVLLEKVEYSPDNTSLKYYNYMFDVDPTNEIGEILNPFDRDDPDNAPRHDAYIVALCDGLIVLQHRLTDAFALLNPSTGKYHIVPPNPAGNINVLFGGFGSERGGCGCYKLVTIVEPVEINHSLDLVIYDVTNSAWRKIKSRSQYEGIENLFSFDTFFDNSGTYVNGRLYWHIKVGFYREIFGFDLEEEEFFETILPDFGDVVYYLTGMVAFDEKLCLMCSTEAEERADIYIMDETYDDEKEEWLRCWNKLFSIFDPKIKLEMTQECVYLYPQCYSACRNKVLFNADHEELVWYNLETEEFEEFGEEFEEFGDIDTLKSFNLTCVRSLLGNGIF